jgi:diguanylate cyclase (GGDEF)-like protein/PAS domain S-box-containing protein
VTAATQLPRILAPDGVQPAVGRRRDNTLGDDEGSQMTSETHPSGGRDPSRLPVLLVDANPADASLVMAALDGSAGRFLVHWVQTLGAARAAIVEAHYECLVVDLELPDAVGLGVIDALREHAVDTAIVVLTGNAASDLGVQPIQRGADDYLQKSEISTSQMRRSVDHAIERKRSEALARETAARSASVLEALDEGVIVFDATARVVSLNPAAETLLDLSAAELIGHHVRKMPWTTINRDGTPLSDDEHPDVLTLTSGQPISRMVVGLQRLNGDVLWIELSTSPLLSPDGQVDGVVVSMHEIGERIAAEESARFQSALLAAIGQAVVVTDAQGQVIFWNPAAERMHGWPAAAALGQPALELVPAASAEQVREIAETMLEGDTWTGDFLLLRRDGTKFPAIVTDTPVFDDAGNLMAVIGVSTDISERKRAEETAQALAAIVETTGDAIFTKSIDGTILTWNRGAEQLYGYTANDAIGCHVSLLHADEAIYEVQSILASVAAGETVRGLETIRHRRDGSRVEVSLTVSPIFDGAGSIASASVIARDVSDRCALERELVQQAMEDTLTGLPNRTLLADRLAHAVAGSGRRGTSTAVLFVDLDHFKNVNDANGHLIGDQLLVAIANRLRAAMRPADTVARFGGDEFVVVCEDADEAAAAQVATRVAETLSEPIQLAGQEFHVTASIGIAVSPPLEANGDVLLRNADAAMYDAKAHGRARYRVFDAALADQSSQRLELTNDLREALNEAKLELHYQPVIELATGRVVGLEALARWHRTSGWVPPAVFVPLAEAGGFVSTLDRWVLKQACLDGAALRARGALPVDARLAVNISAGGIADPDLVEVVRAAAAHARLPLDALEIEVTETGFLTDPVTADRVLSALQASGVGVALDDFGTGYSSFTNLRQLPVTTIKIDRSFVQNIALRPDDLAIVTSVVELAHAIGLRTIAEGVETWEQLALLHRLGCDAGQGHIWSKALPREELARLLKGDSVSFVTAVASADAPRQPRCGAAVTNEHGLHRIVALHGDGDSPTTIAAALNADGFHTPRGMRWHTSSVSRVLNDVA